MNRLRCSWRVITRSLRPDVGVSDDFGPSFKIRSRAHGEFFGRARDRVEAQYREALADLGQADYPSRLAINEADEGLRGPGWGHDALPVVAGNPRVARF